MKKQYTTPYEEGYTKLLTYKQGTEIYQKTKRFTASYLERFRDSRLVGHMNDSARSVPSNIREGAKRRNTKAYLEFLGFARASLEELKGDFEELKRELNEGERWKDKDKEGLIRINKDKEGLIGINRDKGGLRGIGKEIGGLLDLIYGEDCMLGRQIASLERKMVSDKELSQKVMIRRTWRTAKSQNAKFWGLAKEKFGIEKDEKGIVRKIKR